MSHDHSVDVLLLALVLNINKKEKQMCPYVTDRWLMGVSLWSLEETVSVSQKCFVCLASRLHSAVFKCVLGMCTACVHSKEDVMQMCGCVNVLGYTFFLLFFYGYCNSNSFSSAKLQSQYNPP